MTEYLRPKWNITLCMYSHSSYSDAWPCFFSQCNKFMSHSPKALFTDSCPIDVPEDWTVIEYDDSQSYSERVAGCLEKIKTKLCFFHHEDMFLYDKPDYDILDKYEQIVLDDTEIDFVRLRRGVDLPLHQYTKDFTGIDGAPSNWWNGKTVLDAGCGAGRFLEVSSRNRECDVVGVDLSSAIDAAQETVSGRSNVHLVQASIFELPFRPRSFDGVYCIGVIQHTPDPKAAVQSLADVVED